MMQNSNYRKLILFLLLCLGMGARAENVVTVSSAEGAPGDEVTVSIALTNTDAVSTLQVSIPLDESLTLVRGSGELGERCGSHSLTVGVKDGILEVFLFSMSFAPITGNSGEVATFRLKLGNDPGTAALTPSKTVLAGSAGETLAASAEGGTVTTRCAKAQYSTTEVDFGAVPIRSTYTKTVTVTNVGNEDLTITALTFSDVNVFSTTTELPLTLAPGASQQLNITYAPMERGSITRTLKVECNSVSKLNTITLKAQPFAVNELHVLDATGIADEEVTIHLTMNNMDPVSGYQVNFNMPSELEYVANSFALSDRKQDHQAITSATNGTLRIIVYSMSDLPLTGDDGEIGSFRVKLVGRRGTKKLTPTNTVLSATINNKVENVVSAVYGGNITIKSPQISCGSTLAFGAVPVTEPCEKTFTIRNYGNAPLTISRIVFNNEHLSIKESLPIEIANSYGSSTVTVVYNSLEEVAFTATMNIYSNDPELRMTSVTVTGSRFAPNDIAVTAKDNIMANEKAQIDLAVENYDAITGMQFDVEYPHQYYLPYDGNVNVTDRAEGMTVTTRAVDDHTLRCFCYFLSDNTVAPGSGKVLTLWLKPKAIAVPAGNYTVSVKNVKLGTANMTNKYTGKAVNTATFSVKDGLIGDANSDGLVDIADVTAIINRINGAESASFDEQSADVNRDGTIDIGDVTGVINIINQ